MAKQQLLSTGIKINVDASELDTKFAKSAESLNRTLTKSQKALGLFYNEQGLLVNRQEQVVEGLSQTQIKLGYYVDELGRTRTSQGGFIDGLNASQKAMGFFADEVGNIYNRFGELVIGSKKATAAIGNVGDAFDDASHSVNAYDEAVKAMEDAAGTAAGSLSQLGGQTAQLFATIQAATGENDAFTSSIIAGSQGVTTFIEAYSAIGGVMQYMEALRAATVAQTVATEAATVAQNGLNTAMKANPVGLAVAGIAAATAAFATFKSTVAESAETATGAFAEVEAAAKRAGEAIKSAADLARFLNEDKPRNYNELEAEFNNIQAEQAKNQAAIDAAPNWFERAFAGADQTGTLGAELGARQAAADAARINLEELAERENEVGNALIEERKKMLETARAATQTENDRLNAEIARYEAAKNSDSLNDEQKAIMKSYIETLRQKVAENEKKEADKGVKKVEDEKTAASKREDEILSELGIPELIKSLEKTKTPLEQLSEQAAGLDAAFVKGEISQDKYNKALDAIASKRLEIAKTEEEKAAEEADKANAELRSKLGIDNILSMIEAEEKAAQTPFEAMRRAVADYGVALQKGAIDTATYNKLTSYERKRYIEATQKATEEEEKKRREQILSLRNESGIDSLLESLKTPWEKYLEKLDKINGYVAQGAVTAAEAQLLADKALEEASSQNTSLQALEKAKATAKAKAVDTATAGSVDVYKMQVAQANDRQAQMLDAQRQLLASSQSMSTYMFRMQENIAVMAANWPRVYGR